jgi:hypothetical protein
MGYAQGRRQGAGRHSGRHEATLPGDPPFHRAASASVALAVHPASQAVVRQASPGPPAPPTRHHHAPPHRPGTARDLTRPCQGVQPHGRRHTGPARSLARSWGKASSWSWWGWGWGEVSRCPGCSPPWSSGSCPPTLSPTGCGNLPAVVRGPGFIPPRPAGKPDQPGPGSAGGPRR